VVRDFNAKINEQFGDNFRQLNSAVERLVSWQVQYEKQLEALIEQETATRESMTEAALRFTDMVNTASEFAAVARSLQNIVGTVNNQSEQLARTLLLLSGLIAEVREGLPIIEQRIGQMIARSEQGVRPNQETLGAVSRHPAESIQATRA
jgi:ABC-type transporter Mla subunit MlaD